MAGRTSGPFTGIRIPIFAALLIAYGCGPSSETGPVPEYTFTVVHAYPHDPRAFTEGLFYQDGFLYESTGLAGQSSIRKVELQTGKILQQQDVPAAYFGEGIAPWKDRLIALTYTTQLGFVYDRNSLTVRRAFQYPGQGWALTQDGKRLIMDDGTPQIRFWDPETLAEIGRITVTADGRPLQDLNELEWVKGEIYANIWHWDRIARIDPASGKVVGWIDLAGLLNADDRLAGPDGVEQVLNGIAYDAAGDRLFVTGKWWPKLFEIRLVNKTAKTKEVWNR